MDKIFRKAELKAVVALKERIKCSDRSGHLTNPKERKYWEEKYKRELWKEAFKLANDKSIDETGSIDTARQSITDILQNQLPYPISISQNSLWTNIKLANSSYIISEYEEGLLISTTLPVDDFSKLSPDEAAHLILWFDEHAANTGQIVEEVFKAYLTEKKASEVLHTAATAVLEDILKGQNNVWFDIILQKNGRLCCRVMEFAEWLPGKTFRTDWGNLRADFTKALKDLRTRREFGIYKL